MSTRVRHVAVLCALSAVLPVASAQAAVPPTTATGSCTGPVSFQPAGQDFYSVEMCFDQPGVSNGKVVPDTTIQDRIAQVLDDVDNGDDVKVAVYRIDTRWGSTTPVIYDALKRAQGRGAAVHVIVDQATADFSQADAITDLKNDGLLTRVCTPQTPLPSGTLGSQPEYGHCLISSDVSGIMHDKIIVITRHTGSSKREVVVMGSYNYKKSQNQLFQNTAIIRGQNALHDLYFDYWRSLRDDTWHLDKSPATYSWSSSPRLVNFLPRTRSDGDDLAQLLNRVQCGADVGNTVRIAQSSFHDRPDITDALDTLTHQGCTVQVVTSDPADAKCIKQLVPRAQVEYLQLAGSGGIHDKLVVIHAALSDAPTTPRYLVSTGSENMMPVLHNANNNVLFAGTGISGPYVQHFNAMFGIGTAVTQDQAACP